jgi:hypothetical protein
MKGHFVRPIEVREDAVRARKKEIEAEVQRIMSLPDDKRADEIFKMVERATVGTTRVRRSLHSFEWTFDGRDK